MPKINIFGHFSSKRQSQNFSDKILLDNEEILSSIAEIFSRSVCCYENISFKGFKFLIFGLFIFFISVCSFANLEKYKLFRKNGIQMLTIIYFLSEKKVVFRSFSPF